jgi:SAM-dependent methyltransferase
VTIDEAIRSLRQDPRYADLVRDAYLGRDVADSVRRFDASAEFQAVRAILGDRLGGATVLDLGAGTGIASVAFGRAGAGRVIAAEPDESDEVGRGAMARAGADFEVIDAVGERLPLPDASVDIVYARQVLHHAQDLERLMAEVARVLRPGGVMLACREHVVDDDGQLQLFLANHPVHQLAGGENAFPLPRYVAAIRAAGLVDLTVLDPWDSVINAFPAVRSAEELGRMPVERLRRRLGALGRLAGAIPGVQQLVWRRIRRPDPGRMYSFIAHKP